jgi:DNA polymerase-3 subunit gamma/tau
VVAKQEGLAYADEILELVAQNAQGSVRDSLSILDKISTLGDAASLEDVRSVLGVTDSALLKELIIIISEGRANEVPDFFDKLLEKGADFSTFNKDFLEHLRQLLILKVTNKESAVLLSVNDLIFVIRLFLKSFKDLQISPSPDIPLLLASIEAALKRTPTASLASRQQQKAPADTVVFSSPSPSVASNTTSEEIKEIVEKNNLVPEPVTVIAEYDEAGLEEIHVVWPKVIATIKEQNGPLGSLLRASQILAVENGKVVLLVKYEFDRKTIEKNASTIMDAIKTICGKNLGVTGQVSASEPQGSSPVAAMSDALQLFGGELVE